METERVARVIEQKRGVALREHIPWRDLGLDGYLRQVMPVFTQTRDENAGVPPGNSRSTWRRLWKNSLLVASCDPLGKDPNCVITVTEYLGNFCK